MSTFIIAEAGVNHNGSADLAFELVDIAARAGADAVKFQTFSADKLVLVGAEKADYQKSTTGSDDQYAMLKGLEMSEAMHRDLVSHCQRVGIEFMSTPFDAEAADFLVSLGMQKIKIASGEITNEPFLEHLATKGASLILSTGMSTLREIERAVEVIDHARKASGIREPLSSALTLLHCTSNYPANCQDVNLRAMRTIANATKMPVGYSDHTLGLAVSTAAVAMGASIIEKHFTVSRDLEGPDHQASLIPIELTSLVKQIRDVESALGSDEKSPTISELPIRALVRRSVTAVKAIEAGSTVSRLDLRILRPGTGIPPGEIGSVIGRKTLVDIAAGTTLQWSHLR